MRFSIAGLKDSWIRGVVIAIAFFSLTYILFRLTNFDERFIRPALSSIYELYLFLPQFLANGLFSLVQADAHLSELQFIFKDPHYFHVEYSQYIEQWSSFFLYKRWSLLLLVLIWFVRSTLKRKVIYTGLFLIFHIISVTGGLFLLGFIGPAIIDESTSFFLSPTLLGNFVLFSFLLIWLLGHRNFIRSMVSGLGIRFELSDRWFYELVILLFFFFILRDFFIPYFTFSPYVSFLLEIVQFVVSQKDFSSYIDRDHLFGPFGAMAVSKHCLGFLTFYLYAAMIYLTRPRNNHKWTRYYVSGGLLILFAFNLLRLILVFLIAQGENGYARASLHHEIYNVVIYIVVFIMWIIWFEFILSKRNLKKPLADQNGE